MNSPSTFVRLHHPCIASAVNACPPSCFITKYSAFDALPDLTTERWGPDLSRNWAMFGMFPSPPELEFSTIRCGRKFKAHTSKIFSIQSKVFRKSWYKIYMVTQYVKVEGVQIDVLSIEYLGYLG